MPVENATVKISFQLGETVQSSKPTPRVPVPSTAGTTTTTTHINTAGIKFASTRARDAGSASAATAPG